MVSRRLARGVPGPAAAVTHDDNGTRELVAKILLDEERHVDWGVQQRELITQMGLQNYLAVNG